MTHAGEFLKWNCPAKGEEEKERVIDVERDLGKKMERGRRWARRK